MGFVGVIFRVEIHDLLIKSKSYSVKNRHKLSECAARVPAIPPIALKHCVENGLKHVCVQTIRLQSEQHFLKMSSCLEFGDGPRTGETVPVVCSWEAQKQFDL